MSSSLNSIAPTSPAATTAQNNSGSVPPPSANDPLASESTFLTLLVSQLQNQDPLNPTDSNQFVSQLTAYSQLEQLLAINKNTTPASTPPTTPVQPSAPAPAATASTSPNNPGVQAPSVTVS